MAGSTKKWLIGCGVGCSALVLLGILGTIASVLLLARPFDRAVEVQKEVEAEYGSRDEYVPPATGIPAERMRKFLNVRKAVLSYCDDFESYRQAFAKMEELDEKDNPPVGDIIRGVGRVLGAAFGVAGKIGDLTRDRNEALLAEGMGLGEYTWIYVLAYNSYLGMPPNTGLEDVKGHCYSGSEYRTLRRLMDNHIEALEKAGRLEFARRWQEETERLQRSDESVPFGRSQLPDYLAESFAPYHKKLEFTYCPVMAEFDLAKIKKKGLSYSAH